MKTLENFKIIDLSHRLPGPFCGKILCDLGAEVIKIEDQHFKDPFLTGLFAQVDNSFVNWYENLNSKKQISRFDFNSPEDQKKIKELVYSADAVIMGLPLRTCQKIGLNDDFFTNSKPKVVIELLSSQNEQKSMHDLNALAKTGLLSLHIAGKIDPIIDPPFLPIAGITFGHKAATDLLAAYIKVLKTNQTQFVKTYLDESTENLLGIFWPKVDRTKNRSKFLHNGLFPCYSLYKTKDNKYIALAAVEEKFWVRFCEIFKIKTTFDRFHHSTDELFKEISAIISTYDLREIENMTKEEDICLTCLI